MTAESEQRLILSGCAQLEVPSTLETRVFQRGHPANADITVPSFHQGLFA